MDRGDPDRELLDAYEYAAQAWHKTPAEIREQLTDELLVAFFDAATDRERERFRNGVEAQRLGTIFAHSRRAYQSWQSAERSRQGLPVGLKGAALERAVKGLTAVSGGAFVKHQTMPAAELAKRRAAQDAAPMVRWEGPGR